MQRVWPDFNYADRSFIQILYVCRCTKLLQLELASLINVVSIRLFYFVLRQTGITFITSYILLIIFRVFSVVRWISLDARGKRGTILTGNSIMSNFTHGSSQSGKFGPVGHKLFVGPGPSVRKEMLHDAYTFQSCTVQTLSSAVTSCHTTIRLYNLVQFRIRQVRCKPGV